MGAGLVAAGALGGFATVNWYVNRPRAAAPVPLSTQTPVERDAASPASSPPPATSRADVNE